MAFRGWLLLSIAVAFAVGATAADDDWDDEEGTSKVTAPFEVDGEVRHDWGQDNLREWDGAVTWDDDVMVLNGRNFDKMTQKIPHILVEVYAPWCGHCQKFEPIYRKAASQFRLNDVDVVLAKLDGPSEPRLSRQLSIHGFPSFHWYAYGRERSYGGGRRNDSMVEWVTYHARKHSVHEVSSTREADDLIVTLNATEAVIGRFISRWSPEATAFIIGAEEEDKRSQNRSMAYIMILENRGLGALKIGSEAEEEVETGQLQGPAIGPSILLMRSEDAGGGYVHYGRQYKPPKWDAQPPDRRYSLFDPDRVKAWVATFRMPKVVPLTKYWNKVLASPVRNQTLLFSDDDSPGHSERLAAFSMVAERWFGKVLFLQIPSKLTNVLKYFGMKPDEYPALVIAVAGNGELDKGEMYRLDQSNPEYNFDSILQNSVLAGQSCKEGQTCAGEMKAVMDMERVIRSFAISSFEGKEMEFKLPEQDLTEDVMYPNDPVRKLTASNFLDVVLDTERDVFVKFYAPWCGHCKSMKTLYMELCDKFEDRPKIVIAEFDATAHKVPPVVAGTPLSVEGYPTILFWRAERSNETNFKASPLKYQGAREVEPMEAYIRRHSVSLELLKAMEDKVVKMEVELQQAASDERYEEAAKLRDEVAAIRKQLAGSALTLVGEKTEKKDRRPIFSKRIFMNTLIKQEEERKDREKLLLTQ